MKKPMLESRQSPKLRRKHVPSLCVHISQKDQLAYSEDLIQNELSTAIGRHHCQLRINVDLDETQSLIKSAQKHGAHLVGYSTASSAEEYRKLFRRDLRWVDEMVFSGLDFDGNNNLMTQNAEGVVFLFDPGSVIKTLIGKLSNKTKVVGILSKEVTTAQVEYVQQLLSRSSSRILFDANPQQLIRRMMQELHS